MTVLIRYCIKITITNLACPVRHQIILDIDVAFSFFLFLFMLLKNISCVKAQKHPCFMMLKDSNGVSKWL